MQCEHMSLGLHDSAGCLKTKETTHTGQVRMHSSHCAAFTYNHLGDGGAITKYMTVPNGLHFT